MLTIIEMPSLSSTMRKGKVLKWHKREGDFVEKGETLFEVQTDKVSVEVDSLVSGFLRKILLGEGIEVAVNAPIAIIGDNMEEDISSVVEAKPSAGIPPAEKKPEEVEPETPRRDEAETEGEKRIKISPLAKRIAEEEGIEIEALKGTGPGGRITKEDVERAKAERTQRQPIPGKAEPLGKPQPEMEAYEEIELTPMRRVIARRLQESKATAPHFYVDVTADASALKQLRDTLWRKMEKEGAKITFNDILVKIASQALKEFPMVNASFLGDRIRLHKAINIGVAVAVEDGLIVPVVRNADQKSILQISREAMELAGKARNKRLLPHEYEGGTFTITNMGMFGVETFHAILNPPESAILSAGAQSLTSGTTWFKGKNITGLKPNQICKRGISRTFQLIKLFGNMTVLDNVVLGALFGMSPSIHTPEARKQSLELLEFLGLSALETTPAKDLTLVNQKRLEVARGLATRPELLLLDELMAGLNPSEVAQAMELVKRIRERGVTIFMIEHVMKAIMNVCDRIMVLDHGVKIAEGTPEEITTNRKVIEVYLGE